MPTSLSANSTEPRIIALTSGGHALCHISELAFPALIPSVMAEFQIDAEQATLLGVPAIVLFGVGALPAGVWADRRGTREAMTAYFLLVAVAAWGVYISSSIYTLCMSLTLLGAAISIYHPAGLAMLSHGCSNRGRAMGINGVAGSLGVAVGPSLGIYMATEHSWRLTYAVIAMLGCVGWLTSLRFGIDVEIKDRGKAAKSGQRGYLAILPLLFLAMLVGGFNYRTITTVLPTFLSRGGEEGPPHAGEGSRSNIDTVESSSAEGRASAGQAASLRGAKPRGGAVVFFVFALGGIGQLAGGFLADRIRPAALYAVAITATIPCALLMARFSGPAGLSAAVFLAVFMFAQQPLENTMIAEATPSDWRSTVYGLKFILAFGVASIGMYTAGLVWKHAGLTRVFDVYAVGATVMAVIAVWYGVRQKQFAKQAASGSFEKKCRIAIRKS